MHKYTGSKLKWLGLWLIFTVVLMYIYASIYKSYKDDFIEINTYDDALYYSCLMMYRNHIPPLPYCMLPI